MCVQLIKTWPITIVPCNIELRSATAAEGLVGTVQCSISIEWGVIKSDGYPDDSKMLIKALKYHSDDIFFPFDYSKS